MSNRKVYRGLNKRRRFDFRKTATIMSCIILIGCYAYTKIKPQQLFKNVNFTENICSVLEKVVFWKNIDLNTVGQKYTNQDASKQVNNIKTSDAKDKADTNKASDYETQVAVVEGIDVYLIQVGSFDDASDLNSVKSKLEQNKIPYSTVQVDDVNKVQAYISFDENDVRENLGNTRNLFSDAFVAKLEIPVISLEYTKEYEYIKSISDGLNSLLKNYEQEASYINKNRASIDKEGYKQILSDRNEILTTLEKEVQKINYDELSLFKTNLLFYISKALDNISESQKSADVNDFWNCEGLLISSIQMYYEFINVIKAL